MKHLLLTASCCILVTGIQAQVPNNPSSNSDMNWVISRTYNESGTVTGEVKQFYDNDGKPLQTQTHNIAAGQVLAAQPLYDALGRPAAITLAAPINNQSFNYQSAFVKSSSGTAYDYHNFDRYYSTPTTLTDKTTTPDAVSNATIGTLGWYYSNNNTMEPYVGTTGYPYGRSDFYHDGTGAIKRSANAGDVLKMGSGKEIQAYTMPVVNELSHYLAIRRKFLSAQVGNDPSDNLVFEAVQVINHDANGKEAVTIRDKGGDILMSAIPGSDLSVSNTVDVVPASGGTPTGAHPVNYGGLYYFKLLASSTVTVSGSGYTLYNMTTEQPVSPGALPAGYYKLVVTGTNIITLTYSNSYAYISYNFYDQAGRLIGSLAPAGVKALLPQSNLNNYSTESQLPYISIYSYDLKGRLLSAITPDAGTSRFVYRKDGRMRFSQNALQAQTGKYSYTNYDPWGRTIESGEYQPAASGDITFNSTLMTGILENTTSTGGLLSGTKSYWVKTAYDKPDNAYSGGGTVVSGFTQDPSFLAGGISMTQNSRGDKTWYNYDDQGRLSWMIQYISGLGYKTVNYTYDGVGKLTKVVYQKNVSAETFVHYYAYDANERLLSVSTNTTDNLSTAKLQAKYYYYLHGPLKRVEVANTLQGIDYTYTVQGWLKAINNSNRDKDPGLDGFTGSHSGFAKDAFGENIEYYSGDYTRTNSNIASINPLEATAPSQYNGTIRAMNWHSRKTSTAPPGSENPSMYAFNYDSRYQYNKATWGTPNYTTNSFTESALEKEYGISYNYNGNLTALQRTNGNGTLTDNFTYSYTANTNKLSSVINYGTFGYDAIGEMTSAVYNSGPDAYVNYDMTGKVTAIYSDAARTHLSVTYSYNERGQRVTKTDYNTSGVITTTTYYVPDAAGNMLAIYTKQGTGAIQETELPVYAGGRMGIYYKQANSYQYELADHLGNVRSVIGTAVSGGIAPVVWYSDYYPYGYGMADRQGGTPGYRYGYQGQYAEKDGETGWNNFELRMLDTRIGRWMTTDPANQYNSPYISMGNNPISGTDPHGAYSRFGAVWRKAAAWIRGRDPGEIYQSGGEWGFNTTNGNLTVSNFGSFGEAKNASPYSASGGISPVLTYLNSELEMAGKFGDWGELGTKYSNKLLEANNLNEVSLLGLRVTKGLKVIGKYAGYMSTFAGSMDIAINGIRYVRGDITGKEFAINTCVTATAIASSYAFGPEAGILVEITASEAPYIYNAVYNTLEQTSNGITNWEQSFGKVTASAIINH